MGTLTYDRLCVEAAELGVTVRRARGGLPDDRKEEPQAQPSATAPANPCPRAGQGFPHVMARVVRRCAQWWLPSICEI